MRRALVSSVLAVLVVAGAACTPSKPKSGCSGIEVALVLADDVVPTNGLPVETRTWEGKTVRLQRIDCYRVTSASVGPDVLDDSFAVTFEIAPEERQRLEDWTRANLRSVLGLLVRSEIVFVATINSPLPGAGVLSGGGAGWTRSQAEEIAARLAE